VAAAAIGAASAMAAVVEAAIVTAMARSVSAARLASIQPMLFFRP
jgi:hypothetical protein